MFVFEFIFASSTWVSESGIMSLLLSFTGDWGKSNWWRSHPLVPTLSPQVLGRPQPIIKCWLSQELRNKWEFLRVSSLALFQNLLLPSVDGAFLTCTLHVGLSFWEMTQLWPSTALDLWLPDLPSFQPSPKFNSQLGSCSLNPGFQVSYCPWISLTAPANALVGWQCNTGGGRICVVIPKRFKYPLHRVCDGGLQRGRLVQWRPPHALLPTCVTSCNQFSVPFSRAATPTLHFGVSRKKKKCVHYILFYSCYTCSKSPLYFLLFFCQEKHRITFYSFSNLSI